MKNILLLISFLAMQGLSAQTITNDWFWIVGDSYSIFQATNPDVIEAPESGVDML